MRSSILFLLLISGCSLLFKGSDPVKSAKGSNYSVSFALPGWKHKKDKRSDYVFENSQDGQIILANSFCEQFQEQQLEGLAKKTFRTVTQFKTHISEYTTFHNREAFRLEGSGLVDGVKVGLRLMNTRRDNCYYDFVSITPQESVKDKDEAFEKFLSTVVFR